MAIDTVLVGNVTGSAWVRASDGSLTALHQGMRISAKAEIVTEGGSTVQLLADGMPPLTVGESREMVLHPDLFETEVDAVSATVQQPEDPMIAQVLAALESGQDPFEFLDATAAVVGGAAGGGDGGSSFTRLISIIETTTPLALEYPRPDIAPDELPRLGGVATGDQIEDIETPADPTPVDPIPVDPTPVDPTPVDPVDPKKSAIITLTAPQYVIEGDHYEITATVDHPVSGSDLVIELSNGVIITIPVGQLTGSVIVDNPRVDDVYVQGDTPETVTITGTQGGDYSDLDTSSSVTTVVQDDRDPTIITLDAPAVVTEGRSYEITARVDNPVTEKDLIITLDNGLIITIPVGKMEGSVTVPSRPDDNLVQGTGSKTVSINSVSGGNYEKIEYGKTTVTTQIRDNDTPTITVSDAYINEGDIGTFLVDFGKPVDNATTVTFTLVHGTTDQNDIDYTVLPVVNIKGLPVDVVDNGDGTYSFQLPANTFEDVTISIQTTQDNVFEGKETFQLVVTQVGQTKNGTKLPSDIQGKGVGTIVDDGSATPTDPNSPADDDRPSLIIDDASITEGGRLDFKVSLGNKVNFDSAVTLTLVPTTAEIADLWSSGNQTVNVVFGNVTTAVTVQPDGKGGFIIPVTVPKGEQHFTVSVPTVDDSLIEGTELVSLNGYWSGSVANENYKVDASKVATGTIFDNDSVVLNIDNVTVNEGELAEFTIALEGGTLTVDTELNLKLNPDSADFADLWGDGERYVHVTVGTGNPQKFSVDNDGNLIDENGKPTTITVPAGETRITISVPTHQDNVLEFDELFTIGAALVGKVGDRDINIKGSGRGTIKDDGSGSGTDPDNDRPELTVTGGGVFKESNEQGKGSTIEFDVALSNPTKMNVDLTFNFVPHAKNGATLDDIDGFVISYVNDKNETITIEVDGATTTVNVPAGVTNLSIEMITKPDANFEGAEGFDLVVSGDKNIMKPGSDTGTGTAFIVDNATDRVEELGVKEQGGNPNAKWEGTPTTSGELLNKNQGLSIIDVQDATKQGNSWVVDTPYGEITINADGSYTYVLDNDAAQSLKQGELKEETFTYTVKNDKGEDVEQTLTITIVGTNDRPNILDTTVTTGEITEQGVDNPTENTVVTGGLFGDDAEQGTDVRWSFNSDKNSANALLTHEGTYGSIELVENADGTWEWEYTLDNTRDATNKLADGESGTETFKVYVLDEQGAYREETITITVTGSNDAPTAKDQSNHVSEEGVQDGGNDKFADKNTAEGNLLVGSADIDNGDTLDTLSMQSVQLKDGTEIEFGDKDNITIDTDYGSLVVNKDGTYTYTLDNSKEKVNELKIGAKAYDEFTFTIKDQNGATSESKDFTITIIGTNDIPVIEDSSGLTGEVKEAGQDESGIDIPGTPQAEGKLVFSDVDTDGDQGWKWTIEGGLDANGVYGRIELVETNGEWKWVYKLDNDREATQALSNNDTKTETFTVRITDDHGAYSEETITVTVKGTNDIPKVDGDGLTHVILEDSAEVTGDVFSNIWNPEDSIYVESFTYEFGGETVQGVVGQETQFGDMGTFQLEADGTYTFTPSENFSGTLPVIHYTAKETAESGQIGKEVSSSLTIKVSPVADAPTLEENKTLNGYEDLGVDLKVGGAAEQEIPLELKVPTVTDATDKSGSLSTDVDADTDDNPELLGPITLSGFKDGDQLTKADGTSISIVGGKVVIVLKDGPHITNPEDYADGATIVELTPEEYQGLKFIPKDHDGTNRDLKVEVTSYEVDNEGKQLTYKDGDVKADGSSATVGDPIPGATSTQNIKVDIKAVTDDVKLTFKDGGPHKELTATEDIAFNLKDELTALFNDVQDGSENRWIVIKGLPEGTDVNGHKITAKESTDGYKITIPKNLNKAGEYDAERILPDIKITAPLNFSGSIKGVEVTLFGQDTDGDTSSNKPIVKDSSVTFNLDVKPVADGLEIKGQTGDEDSAIFFLKNVSFGDHDGSESLKSLIISGIPAGWVLANKDGVPVTGGSFDVMAYAGQLGLLDGNDELSRDNFNELKESLTVQPPSHSSTDATFKVEYEMIDRDGNGSEETKSSAPGGDDLIVTVNPVAEKVGIDSDGDGIDDLTMTGGKEYGVDVTANEDEGFELNQDGFNLLEGWKNQDSGSEETFAILSPEWVAGQDADLDRLGQVAKDASFTYVDSTTGKAVKVSYDSDLGGFKIPMDALDTVVFFPPQDVAGEFKIKVQAYTVDTDEDGGGVKDTAISGEAWLNGITIIPVADGVTALATQGVRGDEDTAITLTIRPSSKDASETFNVKISDIPEGAVLMYDGQALIVENDGSVIIKDFDSSKELTVTPPPNSNENFNLTVDAQSVDTWNEHSDESAWFGDQKVHVQVKGVADSGKVEIAEETTVYVENKLDEGQKSINLKDFVGEITLKDDDTSEKSSLVVSGLPAGFEVHGATLIDHADPAQRVWTFTEEQLRNGEITIKAPKHFSGRLPGEIAVITTENDGDASKFNGLDWTLFNVVVTPSVDGELTIDPTEILENAADKPQKMEFGLSLPEGKDDYRETLVSVKLSKDELLELEAKGLTLFVNGEKLTDSLDVDADRNYTISGVDLGNVTFTVTPEFAHNNGVGFKLPVADYEVEPVEDSKFESGYEYEPGVTTPPTEFKGSQEFTITVTPVTDGGTIGEDGVEIDGEKTEEMTLNKVGEVAVTLNLTNVDMDGSESITKIELSGVPKGMLVKEVQLSDGSDPISAVMTADGKWVLLISEKDAARFGKEGVTVKLILEATSEMEAGLEDHEMKVTVFTQDKGSESVKEADVTLKVNVDGDWATGGPGSSTPDVDIKVETKLFSGSEDASIRLGDLIKVTLDPEDANFSIVVALPAGANVSAGAAFIGYENGKALWMFNGKGKADLDNILNQEITPPTDYNYVRDGSLDIDVTVNAYLDKNNGNTSSKKSELELDLTPVTDGPDITVTFSGENSAKPKEGEDINVNITLKNTVDAPLTIIDGKVYVKISGDGKVFDANGTELKFLTPEQKAALGLETDGNYVAVDVGNIPFGDSIDITLKYQPTDSERSDPDNFKLTVDVSLKSEESGASNKVPSSGTGSTTVALENNGYQIGNDGENVIGGIIQVKGDENQGASSKDEAQANALKLKLGDNHGLNDSDGSEVVYSAMIKGLPEGFLVFVDGQMALNAGNGNWILPLTADGKLPEGISILPPLNWSGSLNNLTLEVTSGEKSLSSTRTDSFGIKLTVDAVVDGVRELNPDTAFGVENQLIALNLNVSLIDGVNVGGGDASVEKATVVFTGLDEYAAFFIDGVFVQATYANGKYTIEGLTQEEVNKLQISQKNGAYNVGVTVSTYEYDVDGNKVSVQSAEKSSNFNLSISGQTASSGEAVMYSGSAITGLNGDTVFLRPGEGLDFATAAGNLKYVGTIDLTRNGYDNALTNLSVEAMENMFANSGTLIIKANSGDSIGFSDGEWVKEGNSYKSSDGNYTVVIDGTGAAVDIVEFVPELAADTTVYTLMLAEGEEDWGSQKSEVAAQSPESEQSDGGVATTPETDDEEQPEDSAQSPEPEQSDGVVTTSETGNDFVAETSTSDNKGAALPADDVVYEGETYVPQLAGDEVESEQERPGTADDEKSGPKKETEFHAFGTETPNNISNFMIEEGSKIVTD